MSSRNLEDGKWVQVRTECEYNVLRKHGNLDERFTEFAAVVQVGEFQGPGHYYVLEYSQRCPRNCCFDDVVEVLSAEEVCRELQEDLMPLYEQAKLYMGVEEPIVELSEEQWKAVLNGLDTFIYDRCIREEGDDIREIMARISKQTGVTR